MCGRFSLFHNAEEIRRMFKLAKMFGELVGGYNIARTAAIITVDANNVLRPEDEDIWLRKDADPDDLMRTLTPYPQEKMSTSAIGSAVNDPVNEGPELLNPPVGRQRRLGDS